MNRLSKNLLAVLLAFIAVLPMNLCAQSLSPSTRWHWEEGTIVIDTPSDPQASNMLWGSQLPAFPQCEWAL